MHSPESFVRLASICFGYPVPDPLCKNLVADPTEEIGTIGIFTPNNGASWVFTAGTEDWVRGLGQEPGSVSVLDQITLNVLNRLSQ
jgi:hypothetical protein